MPTKLILCNLGALKKKYLDLTPQIQSALYPIIGADQRAGITTTIVYVDDAAAMKAIGAIPVTNASDPQQNKVAIDGIFNHYHPDFMMILGAPDIIPHQSLVNPAPDSDPDVPSDLPYACSSGYSRNIATFLAPTRVVSRLPDVTGTPALGPKDPTYFLRVLAYAADRNQASKAIYQQYFSVTCDEWKASTAQSLQNIFAGSASMLISPPSGPKWTTPQMAPLSHFVNCHGGSNDPKFYGQQGTSYPTAMDATLMAHGLNAGVAMSAECCYGAQLYNPDAGPSQIPMGMCNTYLYAGSKGYFGSSNIAYGPSSGNGAADLITQYFLINLLTNQSIGSAVLGARLRFANGQDMTKPTNLKTLASFNILGDPVMTPVAPPPPPVKAAADLGSTLHMASMQTHSLAKAIEAGSAYAEHAPEARPSSEVQKAIEALLTERGVKESKRHSFVVRWPSGLDASMLSKAPEVLVHAIGFRDPKIGPEAPFDAHVVLEIRESLGTLLSIEEFHSK